MKEGKRTEDKYLRVRDSAFRWKMHQLGHELLLASKAEDLFNGVDCFIDGVPIDLTMKQSKGGEVTVVEGVPVSVKEPGIGVIGGLRPDDTKEKMIVVAIAISTLIRRRIRR